MHYRFARSTLALVSSIAAVLVAGMPAGAHVRSHTLQPAVRNVSPATHARSHQMSSRRDPAPTECTLATGIAGDANWASNAPTATFGPEIDNPVDGSKVASTALPNPYNMPSLDVTKLGAHLSADGSSITFDITVSNLSDGGTGPAGSPQLYGEGSIWEVDIYDDQRNKVQWFQADYGLSAPTDSTTSLNMLPTYFAYGHFSIVPNSSTPVIADSIQDGTATGGFDFTNNLVSITVPVSVLTFEPNHPNVLFTPGTESYAYFGNPQTTTTNSTVPDGLGSGWSEAADLGFVGTSNYTVGKPCTS